MAEIVAASGVGASVADGIAGDGIAVEEIVVDGIAAAVRLRLGVMLVAGIRGWTRCGSGLLRVERGRDLRMMKLWT
jgi:hypothetical protein